MSAPIGRWRISYTPGDWVVLSGPTSLVVLLPASGKHSSLIAALWEDVVSSASIVELAEKFASRGLDAMPSFGAFFWAEGGMRSLVRGAVEVVDLANGSVVASGTGVQTWSEAGLDGVTRVRIELAHADPADASSDEVLALPLMVGAVRASSVVLDGTPAASLSSPQHQPTPEEDRTFAPDEEEPAEADLMPELPVTEAMAPPFEAAEPELERVPSLAAAAGSPPPAMSPGQLDEMENGDTQLMDPVLLDSMENGDTQVVPAQQSEPEPGVSQDSLVMAVVCQYGHSSPQNATACRICGTQIVPQGPQLVPRPPLALLRASNGATEEVDRVVLVGRAPAANASNARAPRLMTVLSPSHDISRTHVEVAPEGWQVAVTDLRSTNGTVLVQPGTGERSQLPAGEPVVVPLGSVLELGDGVSLLIDSPQ